MPPRLRLRIEIATASVAFVLFLLTLVWSDWIEILFGWDPDEHNGSVEWAIVGGLLVLALLLFGAARIEWRRIRAAQAHPSSPSTD
ncbi:MAG TPA: hypothetical protein VMF62_02060 [Acetobacteraceae bacterium]|nr:hypothetical protein [Acetobacteraceae bacterium]